MLQHRRRKEKSAEEWSAAEVRATQFNTSILVGMYVVVDIRYIHTRRLVPKSMAICSTCASANDEDTDTCTKY